MIEYLAHTNDVVDEGFFGHMMDGGHWANDNGLVVFWVLLLVLMVGVTIAVFVVTNNKSRTKNADNALETLKRRYAKGEITKKQYDDMKKDIS